MAVFTTFTRTRPLFQKLTDAAIARYENLLAEWVTERLSPEFDTQIMNEQYYVPWPSLRFGFGNQYQRVPAGDRNIVDTGRLLNSKVITSVQKKYGTEYGVTWTAEHASAVFNGYVTKWGQYAPEKLRGKWIRNVMPGRDWITPALEVEPLGAFLRSKVGGTNTLSQLLKANISKTPTTVTY
jgi:hypothetical protein